VFIPFLAASISLESVFSARRVFEPKKHPSGRFLECFFQKNGLKTEKTLCDGKKHPKNPP
jgi:hypothetical protein